MTRVVAGPMVAQTLADLGADVVKVERTGDGAESRSLGPPWLLDGERAPTGESTYFQSVDRGKRSIQVDIALVDSQLAMLLNQTAAWLNGGQVVPRTGNDHARLRNYAKPGMVPGDETVFDAEIEMSR